MSASGIPEMMRAVTVSAPGGPDVLGFGQVPTPQAGPGEVLVRVEATALNRADLLQRAGKYPPPPGASEVLGLEMAGEVVAVGEGVRGLSVGERVCGLLPGGGYAEYAALPAALALPLSAGMAYDTAAAIPEAFLTAFQALYLLARVAPGEVVLVHAGASGVGTAAIQLARRAGARVLATASAPKLDAVRQLGAEAIDYARESFADRVLDATEGRGADVILDVIGAQYAEQHLRCLALDGRWVILALMGGARVEHFDLRALFARRAHLITSTLRNRDDAYKSRLTARFAEEAWPGFADGTLRPVIDTVFEWGDVRAAHARMEARANVGKIVLRLR